MRKPRNIFTIDRMQPDSGGRYADKLTTQWPNGNVTHLVLDGDGNVTHLVLDGD